MKVGRPTDYGPQIVEQAEAYLKDFERPFEEFANNGTEIIPTIAGLALYLGISRETVYAWAKDHPEFSDTVDAIKANQERALVAGGLTNKFNASITKLMLAANHSYVERQDITSDGKALPQPILNAVKDDDTN